MFTDLHEKFWGAQHDAFICTDKTTGARYVPIMKGFHDEEILVRKQYLTLWDAVRQGHANCAQNRYPIRGLVITGQPGIGKSLFLKYALLRALAARIPVVYCEDSSRCFIFSEAGGVRCKVSKAALPEGALCLVDSNSDLISPPRTFFEPGLFTYVVQATSPKLCRWKEWAKQHGATKQVMGLWTRDEMKELQQIRSNFTLMTPAGQDTTVPRYTPLELYDFIGPSPRNCFRYAQWFEKTVDGPRIDPPYGDPRGLFRNIDVLLEVIQHGNAPPEQGPLFHLFFFVTNVYREPILSDPSFHYTIPTKYLRRCIGEYFRQKMMHEQLALLTQFAPLPQVAGIFYESLVLDILNSSRESWPCYLYYNAESPSFQLGPGLFSRTYPVDPRAGPIDPIDSCIYVPAASFPSLDAFIVSENKMRVTMLQMTVSTRHEIKRGGIRMVISALKNSLPQNGVKWSILLVTPDKRGQNIVHRLKKLKKFGKSTEVELGWLEVGPEVQKYSEMLKGFQGALNDIDPPDHEGDVREIDDDANMDVDE